MSNLNFAGLCGRGVQGDRGHGSIAPPTISDCQEARGWCCLKIKTFLVVFF